MRGAAASLCGADFIAPGAQAAPRPLTANPIDQQVRRRAFVLDVIGGSPWESKLGSETAADARLRSAPPLHVKIPAAFWHRRLRWVKLATLVCASAADARRLVARSPALPLPVVSQGRHGGRDPGALPAANLDLVMTSRLVAVLSFCPSLPSFIWSSASPHMEHPGWSRGWRTRMAALPSPGG